MRQTIYKYPLEITDSQTLLLIAEAQILSVQFQGRTLCLWALVDLDIVFTRKRKIEIHGTGNPMSPGHREYIGTVQQGPLVWHVFESFDRGNPKGNGGPNVSAESKEG